ncbi:MAG: heparinase II/III family protein, partial [Rhodospirillales bacterium]|nr:heparinase II/III family protein [Rhodospirillales bacterium]
TGNFWKPKDTPAYWLDNLHKFEWLRDLRALGGDDARFSARAYLSDWLRRYNRWDEDVWSAARLGKRLSLWLALYDFYGESADESFQDDLLDSVLRQARHLYRIMPASETGLNMIESLGGLIYAGLAMPGGERWLDYGLEAIAYEAEQQILQDGGHISRNPQTLLQVVMCLSDLRTAITSAGYPLPHAIQHALDRAIPALRFFRYPDKAFGVFNGAQENDDPALERLIVNYGSKGRIPKSLPKTGYERLSAGRTLLMIDTGKAPAWPHDRHIHAAPGAFELTIARERVFVSCGTHPTDEPWQDLLRGTSAHNALTLDHRNALEIRENGHIGRKPKKVGVLREDIGAGQLLTVTHDGYIPINGILHQRRFFVDTSGTDIRGEETLTAKTGTLSKPVTVTLRFHLHPRVLVSLIRDGEEALLLLPSGAGWRFYHEGVQRLTLENSVYLGEGTYPRKTKQLVLTCDMTEPEQIIQWALQKESL